MTNAPLKGSVSVFSFMSVFSLARRDTLYADVLAGSRPDVGSFALEKLSQGKKALFCAVTKNTDRAVDTPR